MGRVAGVFDNPPGFPCTPPGVDILEGGKLTSNNVAGSSHDPLQSPAVASGAVSKPGGDTAGQDALHIAGVEGPEDSGARYKLPQPSQEEETLMCLLQHCICVSRPCEILSDVNAEEFKELSYANIARMRESGYERMPPVEETLASYLSMGDTASLKVPSLPFKSLQDTSRLNGRAYAAAGQAVASLHTMAVLQAYQADLLKDLDDGQGLSPVEVAELRRTTDLALRATKQAATAMGRSMAAMVVTERHLWVNLADLEKKEKGFLLDAPVSPSELFGTSVETVVEKFKEARARSAAFETFIPRRPRSEPEQSRGPGPAWSEDRRRAQKASVATRAPPPPAGRARGRYR